MAMQKPKREPCTWEELSQHSKKGDCWVAMDGKVYDVTSWVAKHPGGADLILMTAGNDITNLFESYHVMSDRPTEILKKYYLCDLSTSEHPKYTVKSPFYETMKQRIAKYFQDNNKDPQNSWQMWMRYIGLYTSLFVMYYVAHFGHFTSMIATIILGVLYGLAEVFFCMHILHDSCHASITHKPKVWKAMGLTHDLFIGGSVFAWNFQHVVGHHVYTNVRGADPDVGEHDVDFRRIAPSQSWVWFYAYQHLYAPVLYGLYGFKTRLQDWQTIIQRTNGPIRATAPSTLDLSSWILGKIIFVVVRFIVPLFFMPVSHAAALFVTAEAVFGYYLAFVFQVSHIAEGLEFLATPGRPEPAVMFDEDWAKFQVRTTQDYGHGNWWTTFCTGSLNYQVAHHLFPSINQCWYPEIAPIILETCKEFGVDYKVRPSFTNALMSHLSYLKKMGKKPDSVSEVSPKNGKSKAA